MKHIINWSSQRLRERSTWLGLVGLLGTVGVGIKPELREPVISAGVGLASLIAVITADRK